MDDVRPLDLFSNAFRAENETHAATPAQIGAPFRARQTVCSGTAMRSQIDRISMRRVQGGWFGMAKHLLHKKPYIRHMSQMLYIR